jgi:predicted transcriptional regulator
MELQLAVIVGLTVSSLAGAIATEDGKYRIARLLIRAGDKSSRYQTEAESDAALLKLIYRKPGSRLRDLKHLASRKDPLTLKLARLESAGYIASSRKGWARQFYVHPGIEPIEPSTRGLSLTIPSSILIEIARNPGIWEAKLVTALGESQQIVHYHLKKLREANLIVSEDDGKRKLYKLSQKNCSQPPPIEPNT